TWCAAHSPRRNTPPCRRVPGPARGGTFPVKVPVPPTKTARKVDAAPEPVNEIGDETRTSRGRAATLTVQKEGLAGSILVEIGFQFRLQWHVVNVSLPSSV